MSEITADLKAIWSSLPPAVLTKLVQEALGYQQQGMSREEALTKATESVAPDMLGATVPYATAATAPRVKPSPRPIARPGAATAPPAAQLEPEPARPGISGWADYEMPDQVGAAPPEAQDKDGTGRSLLRTLAQPFQGAEGKMRLLELLGSAGQGLLAGRATEKAQQRTASSQARANLVGALSRRGGGQGTQYQPTQGIGQTLLGTLAGAGRLGREAITQQKAEAQQGWKNRMEEAGAGREEAKLGLQREGVDLDRDQLAEMRRKNQATEGMQGQELSLSRNRLNQEGALARERLGVQQQQIEAMLEAARIRVSKTGTNSAQAQQAIKTQQALSQIAVLRNLWTEAGNEGDINRPWNSLKAAPLIWRAFPKAKTYSDVGEGIALSITTAIQGARPSDTDREVVALMVPKLGDTQELATGKLKALTDLASMGASLSQQGMVVSPNAMPLVVTFDAQGVPQINAEALRQPGVLVPIEESTRGGQGEPEAGGSVTYPDSELE